MNMLDLEVIHKTPNPSLRIFVHALRRLSQMLGIFNSTKLRHLSLWQPLDLLNISCWSVAPSILDNQIVLRQLNIRPLSSCLAGFFKDSIDEL